MVLSESHMVLLFDVICDSENTICDSENTICDSENTICAAQRTPEQRICCNNNLYMVSSTEYSLFCRALLEKRHIILRSLLMYKQMRSSYDIL